MQIRPRRIHKKSNGSYFVEEGLPHAARKSGYATTQFMTQKSNTSQHHALNNHQAEANDQ